MLHAPRRLILLGLAALIAIGFSGKEFLLSILWAAKHDHVAVLRQGTSVRVPLFWSPGKTTTAPNELRLRRANWGISPSQEWVVLRTNTPPLLPERQRQSLERLTREFSAEGAGPARYSLPSDLEGKFQCLIPAVTQFPSWQLSCVSVNGFWALDLFGTHASQRDLAPVLRDLPPAGKP